MDEYRRGGTDPFFSVVVPCYNRSDIVEETLNSVLRQSFTSFEIIVVDDGSTDDTERVVNSISDPRIRYIRQENGGGGAARNTGIEAAKGEYIAFLDSDDAFVPDKLLKFYERIALDAPSVLYSYTFVDRGVDRLWIKPERPIRADEDVGEYLFLCNEVIQTSTLVVKAEVAKNVRFSPKLKKGQDIDFCLRLQNDGQKFICIQEPLSVWRDYSANGRVSHIRRPKELEEWLRQSTHLMTRRARIGYRATVLSWDIARKNPIRAAYDIARGVFAGVPPARAARVALRAFLPAGLYRAAVNRFVSRRGHNGSSVRDAWIDAPLQTHEKRSTR